MTAARSLVLSGEGLTVAAAARAVLDAATRIEIAADAMDRVRASREVVERAIREGRAVYGVTTGFGRMQNTAIVGNR